MPLPLVIAGAAGVVAGLHSAASAARPFLERYLRAHQSEIEAWALSNAFEALGLPDLSKSPTRGEITEAINEKFLAGSELKLTDIFDARAIREDALKFGIQKAAADCGVQVDSPTVPAMRDALREWIKGEILAQIEAGGGDLIDGAKDAPAILAAIEAHNARPPDAGLLMTPEAVSNRERQARYRAGKTKHWELRSDRGAA